MRRKILLATKNPGKILEYKIIFLNEPIELVVLKDLGISADVEEDQKTFERNAVKKANFYSRLCDLPVIAEDAGLEIDFLNGEPGIFSRRWPGHEANDEELIDIALKKLGGVPREKRGAQFRVVIVFKKSLASEPIIAEGSLRGYITEKPMAEVIPGFPFRVIFYVPEVGKTLGEMSFEEEALIGHRKKALGVLMPLIIGKLKQ